MNIWLTFVPGSGASFFEMLLRTTTALKCLPVDKEWSAGNTAHGFSKQWHPNTKNDLLAQQYKSADDNVFTPIVPMPDFKGHQVLEYVREQSGKHVYIGPSTNVSAEFVLVSMQKVPNYFYHIMPTEHSNKWSDTQLEAWQQREYLSLSLLDWWLPQMQNQWQTANALGYHCIDTMDVFNDTWGTFKDLCYELDIRINKTTDAQHNCKKWTQLQNTIWQDWENLVKYKQGLPATISGDIIQESIIQYHLRKQGIELKCYGLNTFPNSEELKQYYD